MPKPSLIILHGALGSQAQFENLKNLLSGDFQIFGFNFSGHGGQAFEGAFSMDRFAGESSDSWNRIIYLKAPFSATAWEAM